MNEVLKIFLSLSLSGSLLILLFLAGKHFLKDRISRQWQYYIWLIVIARLLLPFAPETNLMGTFFQTIDRAIYQSDTVQPQIQNQDNSVNVSDVPVTDGKQENGKQTETPPVHQPVTDIFTLLIHNVWLIWLVVALILLIQKVTIYKSFVRYVKAGQIPISDTDLLDRLAVIGEQAGVKKPVELCVNPLMSSPLLIGFFHPCIVLPSTEISEQDFRYTVLHELTHYRRRDIFYKWLVQVTVCLHWYNPLVYLMSREINKACEFSCDEAIIAKDSNNAQEYGKTLLDAMAKSGNYKETLASVTLSENKEILKERLGAIMSFKKKSNVCIALSTLLTIIIAFSAMETGAYAMNTSLSDKNTTISENVTNSTGTKENFETAKTDIEKIDASDLPPLVYTGGIAAYNSQFGSPLVLCKGDKISISLLEDLEAWNLNADSLELEISIGGNNGTIQNFVLSNNNRSVTFQADETATHFVKLSNNNEQLLNYMIQLNGFSQPTKLELTNLNERRRFGHFLLEADTSYLINASWQRNDVDTITIILQQDEQITNYEVKNGIPFKITVPKDGSYIIDCVKNSPADLADFLCTIVKEK